MRYMFLIYKKEEAPISGDDREKSIAAHCAVIEDAIEQGVFRAAEPLKPTSVSTTVRVRNGDLMMTDGPFAETKEQLAGYYILDCADLDEALGWAARIPMACNGIEGGIEVRPIQEVPVFEDLMQRALKTYVQNE